MLARRPIIALVVALVLWATTLKAFVSGAIGVFDTAVRFLVAFAIAWIGVTILGVVTAGYGNDGTNPDNAPDLPRRRRTDLATDGIVDVTAVTDLGAPATLADASELANFTDATGLEADASPA